MLASFINQRGTLTSKFPVRLADERQDAKSSTLWCKHSSEGEVLSALNSLRLYGLQNACQILNKH